MAIFSCRKWVTLALFGFMSLQSHAASTRMDSSQTEYKETDLIERFAPGYLVKWCLAEIPKATFSPLTLRRIREVYLPIIRGVHKKVKLKDPSPELKDAHQQTKAIIHELEHLNAFSFDSLTVTVEDFIQSGQADLLNEPWIKAGRLSDFSNSFSGSMTAGALDIQGVGKLIEHGPSMLDGTLRAADGRPMFESSRHLGAHSSLATYIVWLNLIKKSLTLKPELRDQVFGKFQKGELSDAFKLLQAQDYWIPFGTAQKSPLGLFQLIADAEKDSVEFVRGFVFSAIFLRHFDVEMAAYVLVEQVGDVAEVLRRNRKFIQLHPYGNDHAHAIINALHLVYFLTGPNEHYVSVLKRRLQRIEELEPFSEEWHAQVSDFFMTSVQPAVDVVYFYANPDKAAQVLGIADTLTFGLTHFIRQKMLNVRGIARVHQHLNNHARWYLNMFQWGSFTAVQMLKFTLWAAEEVESSATRAGGPVLGQGAKLATIFVVLWAPQQIYAGNFGEYARASLKSTLTFAWTYQIVEATSTVLFGAGPFEKIFEFMDNLSAGKL